MDQFFLRLSVFGQTHHELRNPVREVAAVVRVGEERQTEPERLHAAGLAVVDRCEQQTATQLAWLRTRLKPAAPQALLVAE